MTDRDFYAMATALPLLHGISALDLHQIRERSGMRFASVDEEDGMILRHGQRCVMMTWLVKGKLTRLTEDPHGLWKLMETVEAPVCIEPEAMFSLSAELVSSWCRAGEDALLMCIDKAHVRSTLMSNDIFRTNLVCMLSAGVERMEQERRLMVRDSVEDHIMAFVRSISHGGSEMKLNIRMTDLASIVGETRLNVSRTLNRMQRDGKVRLHRNMIEFV